MMARAGRGPEADPERDPAVTDAQQRAERLRPAELLGLAAAMAVFTGFGVLLPMRDLGLAAIFAATAFIVSLVVMATISITTAPSDDERRDLEEQDRGH